jgi:hypothetical protein
MRQFHESQTNKSPELAELPVSICLLFQRNPALDL